MRETRTPARFATSPMRIWTSCTFLLTSSRLELQVYGSHDTSDPEETEMDQPIACTLRPDEYVDRAAQLRELANRALRSRERITDGERLTFAPGHETEQLLRDAVAAEGACC